MPGYGYDKTAVKKAAVQHKIMSKKEATTKSPKCGILNILEELKPIL